MRMMSDNTERLRASVDILCIMVHQSCQVQVAMCKSRAVTIWAACRHAQDEAAPQGQCGTDIALKWMTEVSSSVYATPIIHDLFSDGHKDIIVPSFVHYLEV